MEVKSFMAIRNKNTGKYYKPANWFPPLFSGIQEAGLYSEPRGVTTALNMLDAVSKQDNDPDNRLNLPQFARENMEVVVFHLVEVSAKPAPNPTPNPKGKGKNTPVVTKPSGPGYISTRPDQH